MVRFLVGAVAALSSVPALAAPAPLAPIGKWQVDYDDAQCVAGREFGDKKSPLLLVLKPSPTSDVMQLLVARKGPSARAVQMPASLSFGTGAPIEASELRYGVDGRFMRSIILSGAQANALTAGDRITWAGKGDLSLSTGTLDAVKKALAACRTNLRQHWNVDMPAGATRPQALTNLGNFFSSFDYPAQALRGREEGRTAVVMMVDEKGAVQDCMVEVTSGIPTLDAQTCWILKERAKFTPAKGSDGKPIQSVVSQAVSWKLR